MKNSPPIEKCKCYKILEKLKFKKVKSKDVSTPKEHHKLNCYKMTKGQSKKIQQKTFFNKQKIEKNSTKYG